MLASISLLGIFVTSQPPRQLGTQATCRRAFGDREEIRLILRIGDPGELSHLAEGDTSQSKRFVNRCKSLESSPDPHPFARCRHLDVEHGCHPVRACASSIERPITGSVESDQEMYEPVLRARPCSPNGKHLDPNVLVTGPRVRVGGPEIRSAGHRVRAGGPEIRTAGPSVLVCRWHSDRPRRQGEHPVSILRELDDQNRSAGGWSPR